MRAKDPARAETTALLRKSSGGDEAVSNELFARVYQELRAQARAMMRHERQAHTLWPTALVHEVFLRLVEADVSVEDQNHFKGIAAKAMRQVLIDWARRKKREKHGAGHVKQLDLEPAAKVSEVNPADHLALNAALEQLKARSPRKERVVELLYYGGLTQAEAATVLNVSLSTIESEWRHARAFLKRELKGLS